MIRAKIISNIDLSRSFDLIEKMRLAGFLIPSISVTEVWEKKGYTWEFAVEVENSKPAIKHLKKWVNLNGFGAKVKL